MLQDFKNETSPKLLLGPGMNDLPPPAPSRLNPLDEDFKNETSPELLLGPGMNEWPRGLCKRQDAPCKYNWDCCGAALCRIKGIDGQGTCDCQAAPDVNGCTGGVTGPSAGKGIPPTVHCNVSRRHILSSIV
eukprot:Platyproteum_vivax@DN7438_c0_g1_i3.p1